MCRRALCRKCRRGPRHTALCHEHRTVRLFAGWAEALRTSGEIDAELAAAALRGGGIPAHVLSQKDSANVVTFGALSIVRVLVPAHMLNEARELLESEGFSNDS